LIISSNANSKVNTKAGEFHQSPADFVQSWSNIELFGSGEAISIAGQKRLSDMISFACFIPSRGNPEGHLCFSGASSQIKITIFFIIYG